MKMLRWSAVLLSVFVLFGSGAPAERDLPLQSVVVPGGGFWPATEAPSNLVGETDASDLGGGFCCAVLGGDCFPKTEFQVGELMWFNSYVNDISNGGLMVYDYTLALKAGKRFVILYQEPVTYDVSAVPVGQEFTGCTGAPWIVVEQLRGRTAPWGVRLVGNGGQVGGPLGAITGLP